MPHSCCPMADERHPVGCARERDPRAAPAAPTSGIVWERVPADRDNQPSAPAGGFVMPKTGGTMKSKTYEEFADEIKEDGLSKSLREMAEELGSDE